MLGPDCSTFRLVCSHVASKLVRLVFPLLIPAHDWTLPKLRIPFQSPPPVWRDARINFQRSPVSIHHYVRPGPPGCDIPATLLGDREGKGQGVPVTHSPPPPPPPPPSPAVLAAATSAQTTRWLSGRVRGTRHRGPGPAEAVTTGIWLVAAPGAARLQTEQRGTCGI